MTTQAPLADPELWTSRSRVDATFRRLRDDEPVSWQAEPESPGFATRGYWAVTRHDDVMTVSNDAATFSCAEGTSIRDLPPDLCELLGSMLNMDDPRHGRLRRVVSRAFGRRSLADVATICDAHADELVRAAAARGTVDAVEAIAAPLPARVIGQMLGIDAAHWPDVERHGDTIGTGRDARQLIAAARELHALARRFADERSRRPGDDLISAMVHADVEGEKLSADEIGSFFTLLVVAGAQTTRHAISHGLLALAEHPDAWRYWQGDFDGRAAAALEEIVRWATPVRHFRRTATRPVRLGAVDIPAGDKVVLWYTSANRDPLAFTDPDVFDVGRAPNPHLAYGVGPHACLGAALSKVELQSVFRAVARRCPDYEVLETVPLGSAFLDGHASLTCRFAPRG